jgi:hypothetical protein
MSADDFEQQVPVSQYGRARREAWLAGLQVNADAMTAAAMEAHRADHLAVTAGQTGLFGNMTPQQQAANVVARRRVGDDWGAGRDLEMLGGTNWEQLGAGAVGPIPGGAYIAGQLNPSPEQLGESPLLKFMRERQ